MGDDQPLPAISVVHLTLLVGDQVDGGSRSPPSRSCPVRGSPASLPAPRPRRDPPSTLMPPRFSWPQPIRSAVTVRLPVARRYVPGTSGAPAGRCTWHRSSWGHFLQENLL